MSKKRKQKQSKQSEHQLPATTTVLPEAATTTVLPEAAAFTAEILEDECLTDDPDEAAALGRQIAANIAARIAARATALEPTDLPDLEWFDQEPETVTSAIALEPTDLPELEWFDQEPETVKAAARTTRIHGDEPAAASQSTDKTVLSDSKPEKSTGSPSHRKSATKMAGYQCSCGYTTGDTSNFTRHMHTCGVETHGGDAKMASCQCSCGYTTGDTSNFNRHMHTCGVETHGGAREHSGRKPKVDDEDPLDLRDLKAFYKALDSMTDLRVCAVCGEERGKHHFTAIKTYNPKDDIFIPMDSSAGVRSLILVDRNSDGTVLVCNRCSADLRKHKRPKWAVHFAEPDARLLQLTNLEFRLVRPVVPIVSFLRLPGEGQSGTTGGSINFHNDTQHVASRLPRHPHECDLIAADDTAAP